MYISGPSHWDAFKTASVRFQRRLSGYCSAASSGAPESGDGRRGAINDSARPVKRTPGGRNVHAAAYQTSASTIYSQEQRQASVDGFLADPAVSVVAGEVKSQ